MFVSSFFKMVCPSVHFSVHWPSVTSLTMHKAAQYGLIFLEVHMWRLNFDGHGQTNAMVGAVSAKSKILLCIRYWANGSLYYKLMTSNHSKQFPHLCNPKEIHFLSSFPFILSIFCFFVSLLLCFLLSFGLFKYCFSDVRENGIYWKDQKDDLDGVTIPTPYLQQFSRFKTNRHTAVRSILNGSM